MTISFFACTAKADVVIFAAGRGHWVRQELDWSAWGAEPRYKRLRIDPDALPAASASGVARLPTMLIRGDRSNEGLLAPAFMDGTVRGSSKGSPPFPSLVERTSLLRAHSRFPGGEDAAR